jgi:fumarate reductase iron-sulfur subunit
VVKDLAVDMAAFFDKWKASRGYFEAGDDIPDEFAVVKPESRERRAADEGIECIGCGICHSACDVVAWDKSYLGPAALNRAWTLLNDVRDRAQAERMDAVAGDAGCHACHTHMSCTNHCPKAIAPTYAIAGLKRAVVKRALRQRS